MTDYLLSDPLLICSGFMVVAKSIDLVFLGLNCSWFLMREMEISLIGLHNAGKTSLVNIIAVSQRISLSIQLSLFLSSLSFFLCSRPVILLRT